MAHLSAARRPARDQIGKSVPSYKGLLPQWVFPVLLLNFTHIRLARLESYQPSCPDLVHNASRINWQGGIHTTISWSDTRPKCRTTGEK
jgi:hypothetical protein